MAKRYIAINSAKYAESESGEVVMYSDHIAEITALKARIAELECERESRYPWHEAPDWAMWAATDSDGYKAFYENEPNGHSYSWSRNGGNVFSIPSDGVEEWRKSIEKRPGT